MTEEGSVPHHRDILRLGLIVFFAACTGLWADWMVLRVAGGMFTVFYGTGFVLALCVRGFGRWAG